MVSLSIAEVLSDFPEYRVALVVADNLAIAPVRPPALATAITEVEAAVAATIGETPLGELDALVAWRAVYKAFGVRKTSYRSSVERLLKSIGQGRGLPRVNSLVDTYNAISARHAMPVGADDLDRVAGALAFRYADGSEDFVRLGDAAAHGDPPKPGEVIYADAEKVLCRRWNWHQHAGSAITPTTRRAVLTVQSLGTGGLVETAAEELCRWLAEHCAAACDFAVAEDGRAEVTVGHV